MNRFAAQLLRIIPAAGFALLCALCGVGLSSLVASMLANGQPTRNAAIDLYTNSGPILFAGGVVGLVIGIVVSVTVLRMDPEKAAKIEERFLGRNPALLFYFGVPVFVLVLMSPLLARLAKIADRVIGPNADIYVVLGVVLVVVAVSLFFYDRIPRKFLMSLSVVAWFLALSVGLCFFFFFGPGHF